MLGPGRSSPLPCLGFLAGSCAPHFDAEPRRRPDFHTLIASGQLPSGIGIDDGAAVLFEDEQLTEVVVSQPQARAYRVTLESNGVSETPLAVCYLGETS